MGIKIDIAPKDLKTIKDLLKQYLPNTLVWAFGSRVKFTAKPTSDLDLVAFISKEQELKFSLLKDAMEGSNIPFRIDLHNWHELPETFHKNIESSYVILQEDMKEALPSDWKTYKLDDLINVKHGFAFKGEYFSDEPTNDILLSPGNFKIGGGFKSDKFKYYKGDFPKDYILREGDIIITMTDLSKAGDTLGYSAKIPPHNGINYLHNQRLGLVQFKNDDIDPDFLYWILRTQPYQYYIVGSATGSTVKHTSPTRICSYEFEAPEDKATQQEIAKILTSLDDKIELNLQMNQTLEAMAQALFKEWFLNFNFPTFDGELENDLPKGWKECSMRDFGKIICGKTPSKAVDEYFGGEYMFIKIPDMHNSVFIIETTDSLTELGLNSQTNKTIPPYSICISSIATVGLVCINPEPCQTNQQINTIVPKNSFLKYYLYFLAISMKETFLATASGGTATLNMNTSQFSNLNAIMPSDEILKEFDEVVSPMMAKILENNYCNQALTQTRDTLLPKLMSGKLEIKN